MIGSKLRPNDRNISKEHIATLLATEKSEFEVNETLPPFPFSFLSSSFLSSVLSHSTWSNFKVEANL